jgi:hypothetical protein
LPKQRTILFDGYVFFLDKDNAELGTWGIRDRSFIVSYSGELYVNKALFDKMVNIAKQEVDKSRE